jgi:hypothetical protein
MMERHLIGRCGLYCGACTIYRAERDRAELRGRMAEHFKCKPEEIRCVGCNPEDPGCWTPNCNRSKCLMEKGFQNCADCPDARPESCDWFAELRERYLARGFDVAESLALLRQAGPEGWLKRMEARYGCPACGTKLTLSDTNCTNCGNEVSR